MKVSQDPQDPLEERFVSGKFLKSLKWKDSQDPRDPKDPQEERFSGGFSRGVLLNCSMLVCCRLFSQIA